MIKKVAKFDEKCDVDASYPQYLDFFWNYNTTTKLNYQNGDISYQLTDTDI